MRVLLLIAVVLVAGTGCGGSSKKPASHTTSTAAGGTTSTTTTAASTSSTTSSTATSAAAGTTTATSTVRSAFASTKNCTLLRALDAKISQAVPKTFGLSQTNVVAETSALQALARSAPTEIRGDFEIYASVFTQYIRAFANVGLKPGRAPTASQFARITKAAAAALNTPGLPAAEGNVKRWVKKNCPRVPGKR